MRGTRRWSVTQDLNSAQFIFNLMQNFPKTTMVMDVRSPAEFNHMRLHNSLNIPYCDQYSDSPSMQDLRQHAIGDLKLFDNRRRLLIIIVFSPPGIVFAREVAYILWKDKCKEVHVLEEEFGHFAQKYPFLCLGDGFPTYKLPAFGYPSEIIPFQLYLGDYHHAEDPLVVECLKITHILNATNCFEARFMSKGVVYLRLGVEDLATEDISKHFQLAYNFIKNALKEPRGRVLVHCAQGVSRSSTYVIMYLMRSRKINYEAALNIVKLYREVACPNEGFAKQLQNLIFTDYDSDSSSESDRSIANEYENETNQDKVMID
ncbi:unnamed protein product [Blepharisma stoltei]|uniref:protein-tyrosine-phosphatase n=1 Tax=Blepharisma stoltei TaxID=1481888 RepID=A0AAU9J713_9CILI|nr:unnamed protein product [Blepharisma stoltei]